MNMRHTTKCCSDNVSSNAVFHNVVKGLSVTRHQHSSVPHTIEQYDQTPA